MKDMKGMENKDHNTKKPNIIFILIDDMGWKDLSCYGSSFYETPNIDRLAGEGMRFTNCYAASPVCSPTRASIMTGKYPARVGVTDWIDFGSGLHPCRGKLIDAPYINHLPLEENTIASSLKEAGYNTWHVGKWHLGKGPFLPENYGFDVNIGGCHWGMPLNGYFSPYGIETLEEGPKGEYLTDRLTDEAIRLIKNNNGKPFFLNLWYYAVHIPIQAKEDDIERFRKKAKEMGLDKIDPFEVDGYFPCEHNKNNRIIRRKIQSDPAYAAMIYNLDWNIGRLIKAVDETGELDNTVIIFTSDNGGLSTAEGSPTCNAPLSEGKGWMYEGGLRVPLIVKWPNIAPKGSICSHAVVSPDFYPTLLEIAQQSPDYNQHVDGQSFFPILCGNAGGNENLNRRAIYFHYPHYGNQGGTPGASVIMNNYKLIEFFEDKHLELYNLDSDLSEKENLADKMPDLAQSMYKTLKEWRTEVKACLPQPNPGHQLFKRGDA